MCQKLPRAGAAGIGNGKVVGRIYKGQEGAGRRVGLAVRALQLEALEKNVLPGKERSEQERPHHELYQHARIGDQAEDRQVLCNGRIQIASFILVASGAGIRVARIVARATQASFTAAVTSSASPRSTR